MVYLPAERVLLEVDAFSPGAAVNPCARICRNISRRKLNVERIVPLHGRWRPLRNAEGCVGDDELRLGLVGLLCHASRKRARCCGLGMRQTS